MGVHGLTPFLRKAYPHVLKELPERFKAFRGKRLVIDGTLITQRFHFIPGKHPYQHIISWYRLAQELNENGVSGVAIFDGKERNHAKAREARRRRETRELAVVRASIEQNRFARLNKIKDTLHHFTKLQNTDQRKVTTLLTADAPFRDAQSTTLLQERTLLGGKFEDSLLPLLPEAETLKFELPLPKSPEEIHSNAPISAQEVAAQFKSLFLGFKANVAKLVTLSVESSEIPPSPLALGEDERMEKVMSKSQYDLTVDENRFWKDCISTLRSDVKPLTPHLDVVPRNTQDQLNPLVDKSFVMASMYERRTNVPTQETYRQARYILEALGIPCIEVNGAYEAEAMASSMVLAGLADHVVSEDTDVLVYEAPLIRNITSRDPFLMVSGADVRQGLDLTRDEYIDFVILLGTDFSQRITNVGPVRALKMVKELGCIENIVDSIANDPKYSLKLSKSAYLAQVDIARSVFKTLPPVPTSDGLRPIEKNDEQVEGILKKYGIMYGDIYHDHHIREGYKDALIGNYFNDTPFAI